MKITFLGAAHQVTGSRTLVEWLDGRYLLVDCGMEQGVNDFVQQEMPVPASAIEYVMLTHAHIDHSGLLPLLYKEGFRGKIYATAETADLCAIMLADSASIQESDAEFQNRKNERAGLPPVEPLYTAEDVAEVMPLFRPCRYGEFIAVDEGLTIRFTDAGHLLGSAFLEMILTEEEETRSIVFSGDVGNLNQPIIRDPQPVEKANYLVIESTYGMRLHERRMDPIPMLTEVLSETFARGGTVIIPSFAVGRTQELLYFFREMKMNGMPADYPDFPVYVDSPLANEATAVFLQCDTSCLDEETLAVMARGENPIWFDGLNTLVSVEESRALNENRESKVIIASGGMCEGGRIRHHLKHSLWDPKNTVLFVGFQAPGTLGRIIYDGAESVKILGETIECKAEIRLLQGVSAHADQAGLLSWLDAFVQKPGYVFVNHGDPEECEGFARIVTERCGIPALAPYSGACFDLKRGEWIRLTEPEYRQKDAARIEKRRKESKPSAYDQLMDAVRELNAYAGGLKEHANGELRDLTEKIRALMS